MIHDLLTAAGISFAGVVTALCLHVRARRRALATQRRLAVQNEAWRKMEAFRKSGAERTIMMYALPRGKNGAL